MEDPIKNILFQYFSGMASPLQRTMITEWLRQEDATELFYQWLEEWEKAHVQFDPGVEAAAARIMDRIAADAVLPVEPAVSARPSRLPFYQRKGWLWAASVIVVFGVSYLLFGVVGRMSYRTGYGEVKEFTLPDGSHIILNANSTLRLSRWGFGNGNRRVELDGEAAFSVKHTLSKQKFVVNTDGQLNIEVLGTEFSVYSRNRDSKVELKKGAVKLLFRQEGREPLIMKPGDVVKMNTEGELSVKHLQPESNFIAWKEHRFVFDSTTLGDAVHYIQDLFGDKIIIGNDLLKEKRITGSFKADSSAELLSILTELYNLEVRKQAGSLVLVEKAK